MAKKQKFKLVFRPGKPVVILAIAALIVLSVVVTLAVHTLIDDTRQQTEALRAEAYQLEEENSRLEQYIEEYGTIRGIIKIAQEKLGLVDPDTVIFDTENN